MQRFSNKVTAGLFYCCCVCSGSAVSCRLGDSLDGYSSGNGVDSSADSQDSSLPLEANVGGSGGSAGLGGASGGSASAGGSGGLVGSGGEGGSGGVGGSGGSGGFGGGGEVGPPSCIGLAKACGDNGDKSCCSSLYVPGGNFLMGRSEKGSDACPSGTNCSTNEQPEHDVRVSEFLLDEFQVTVGRFRQFVAEYEIPKPGAGAHPKILNSGWNVGWDSEVPSTGADLKTQLNCNPEYQTWLDTAGDTEQHPINCVSWYVAFAFCAWDGGRFPTEAEWEKAAAGGDENRLYPWGAAAPDGTRAAFGCVYDGGSFCTFADIAKVGSLPAGAGRWGHKDLAGNMWEWVLDSYNREWYSGGGKICTDCACLPSGSERVVRGGAYVSSIYDLRSAFRGNSVATNSNYFYGFRCARDL